MVNVAAPAPDAGFEVEIADIEVAERLRAIDPAHVALIAGSMQERGQLTPILVRRRQGRKGKPYILVAGGHRVEAANLLAWSKIRIVLFDGSEGDARMAEIDENLIRHELNPFDRAVFMAERKNLYEELHPEARQGGDRRSEEFQNDTVSVWSFSKDTAEKCGINARTIERAVRIATQLCPEAKKRIPGTWLAKKQAELLALTHLEPAHQLLALDMLLASAPTVTTVEAARKIVQGVREETKSDTDRQLEKLVEAWQRAGAPARRAFLALRQAAGDLETNPKLEQVA
ncbi:MAG: ParB N-terminal domain-containing protein [Azospirillaceae bacterium]|nr:ParB N-terminal domain-containing protein [Azospirillaceae bacterium]